MSLQNPLHPGTILTALKIGKERLISILIVMPPNSQIVFSIAPPQSTVWVLGIQSVGLFRDWLTGNPIISPLISVEAEHAQIGGVLVQALDSVSNAHWGTVIDISTGDPLVTTITNGTALFVSVDITQGIFDMPQRLYDEVYLQRWRGLDNLLNLLGSFTSDEIGSFAKMLRDGIPTVKQKTNKYLEE